MGEKAASAAPPLKDEVRFAAAFTALFLGALAMGTSPIFVRLADVGPFASAFWRVALALPFLYAWALWEAHRRPPGRLDRATRGAVILSGLFFAGDLFFWHLAIVNTTVANATFLATMAPIVVVLGAWAFLREAVTPSILAGLALCLAGAGALVGSSYALAPDRLAGDVYGLVTACFFGAYFLAIRRARRDAGAARIIFLSTAVTAAALFFVALALEPRVLPASAEGVLVLLALALVSQVGGQGLLTVALGHLPAAFSSLVIFLEAVAAAILGWLVLAERLDLWQIAGGVFILAGIFVARPRRTSPRPHNTVPA